MKNCGGSFFSRPFYFQLALFLRHFAQKSVCRFVYFSRFFVFDLKYNFFSLIYFVTCAKITIVNIPMGIGYVIFDKKIGGTLMTNEYVTPKIDVVSTAAADVISSSITYDENEVYEDKFFSV